MIFVANYDVVQRNFQKRRFHFCNHISVQINKKLDTFISIIILNKNAQLKLKKHFNFTSLNTVESHNTYVPLTINCVKKFVNVISLCPKHVLDK